MVEWRRWGEMCFITCDFEFYALRKWSKTVINLVRKQGELEPKRGIISIDNIFCWGSACIIGGKVTLLVVLGGNLIFMTIILLVCWWKRTFGNGIGTGMVEEVKVLDRRWMFSGISIGQSSSETDLDCDNHAGLINIIDLMFLLCLNFYLMIPFYLV